MSERIEINEIDSISLLGALNRNTFILGFGKFGDLALFST